MLELTILRLKKEDDQKLRSKVIIIINDGATDHGSSQICFPK